MYAERFSQSTFYSSSQMGQMLEKICRITSMGRGGGPVPEASRLCQHDSLLPQRIVLVGEAVMGPSADHGEARES